MQMNFNTLIQPKNESIEQTLLSLDIFERIPFLFSIKQSACSPKYSFAILFFLCYWVSIATAFLGYLG